MKIAHRISESFAQPAVRALVAVVAIVIMGLIFNADGAFFRFTTHRDMLRQISVFGILGCGMTLVILTGGIDLSVGSVLGLSSVIFSILSVYWQWNAAAAVVACLCAGAALGAVSGVIIAGFRVQPFIATLAMMVLGRGAAKWLSGGEKISSYSDKAPRLGDGSIAPPPEIFDLVNARVFGDNIAAVTLVFLVCIGLCLFLLRLTVYGRYVYAIGGNEEATRFSGVRTGRVKIATYALSGMFAALAGICQAGQEMQGDPEAGQTYELTAIAIVVIGGTSLMGGRGGVGLTLIGAFTIGYLEKILSINNIDEAARLMLTGVIIVAAVLFQRQKK